MIAIIDSGSTKADWIFTNGIDKKAISTTGMNPTMINEKEIIKILKDEVVKHIAVNEINEVHYFGTGCSGEDQKKIVSTAFKEIFANAKISVDSDVRGAVIATCGDESGISCIIGTGSNSVYFDGKNILPNNYGLGYLLADEGAGTYLGKKIITNYLYGLLPKNLSDDFQKKYNLTREIVINNVYSNPTANSWLASFSEFYSTHREDLWIRKTIRKGFEKFIKLFVLNYKNHEVVPVHFVGSIAFFYKDILEEVAADKKIILGKVIQKPMDGLVDYFNK